MTNSDKAIKAEKIIDEVFKFTDEEYLYQRIDRPIEKAFSGFEFDSSSVSQQNFFNIIGSLVHHIYKHGLTPSLNLSHSQACAEALAILEEGYQNPHARGYYAAFLDATDPTEDDGLKFVLAQIAEYISLRARARHIIWGYTSKIDPTDWTTKCLIAEILLKRWENFLPPIILSCAPSQLADSLPDLFEALCTTNRIVTKTMGADTDLNRYETATSFPPLSQTEQT